MEDQVPAIPVVLNEFMFDPFIYLVVPIKVVTVIVHNNEEGQIQFARVHITTVLVELIFEHGNLTSVNLIRHHNHHEVRAVT